MYTNLQPRITKALFEAINPAANKPLTTQYGAVVAITRLGPLCVELLLLPELDRLTTRLWEIMAPSTTSDNSSSSSSSSLSSSCASSSSKIADMTKLHEAQQVYAALLHGMALYVRDRQKTTAQFDEAADGSARPAVKRGSAKKRFATSSSSTTSETSVKGGEDGAAADGSSSTKRARNHGEDASEGLFGEALQPFAGSKGSLSLVL